MLLSGRCIELFPVVFFNHDAIETLFFIGFQDQEEMGYRSQVLGRLDGAKLRVEDGQILVEENKEN